MKILWIFQGLKVTYVASISEGVPIHPANIFKMATVFRGANTKNDRNNQFQLS